MPIQEVVRNGESAAYICLYLTCNTLKVRSVPVPINRYVILLRVSTQKQGADGLGIAAQKRDIEIFLHYNPEVAV